MARRLSISTPTPPGNGFSYSVAKTHAIPAAKSTIPTKRKTQRPADSGASCSGPPQRQAKKKNAGVGRAHAMARDIHQSMQRKKERGDQRRQAKPLVGPFRKGKTRQTEEAKADEISATPGQPISAQSQSQSLSG